MYAIFVPLMLLFGFLTAVVRKGADFDVLLALVLVGMAMPTFVVVVRRAWSEVVPVAATVVLGFCVWAFAAHAGVRVYAGPVWLGGSVVLAVVWAAVVLSAMTVAVRTATRYARSKLFTACMAATIIFLAGMVISPALFALGATSYAGWGLYYGLPLVQQALWVASGVLAGAIGAWVFTEEAALPPETLQGGMYVLAFTTGVATGEHFWIPAVLGLLLVQYAFHLKSAL